MDALLPVNNFSSGQLGRSLFGRFDLPSYKNGLARCFNFLPLLQGPAKFRPGTEFYARTRGNKVPSFREFVFNDEQSYVLEFTEGGLRFLDSGGLFLEDEVSFTGVSAANPAVISAGSHGYADGDEIYVSGIAGNMSRLNGQFYTVSYINANTFSLLNIYGVAVNTTGLTYTSGGTGKRTYTVATPYSFSDIAKIQIAQEADVAYLVDGYHEPMKLSRLSQTNWTLSTFDRTEDPFLTASITGITRANPGVITTGAEHGLVDDEIVSLRSIGGMTELNGLFFKVDISDTTHFSLKTLAGVAVDTSAYSAYTTGGKVFSTDDQPSAVGLYGGRLFYGGTNRNPDGLYGSKGPEDTGEKQYDDFTVGADAVDAVRFFIASGDNTLERIQWFAASSKFLGVGGITDVYKATGADGDGSAITGTSISVRPTGALGVADARPARQGASIFYIQRGSTVLNSFEYDIYSDGFVSIDQSLLNPEICRFGLKQLAFQQGAPSFIWAIDNRGNLLSLTYKASESISAWALHRMGGADSKVLTIASEPLPNSSDQLWVAVERTINGQSLRYIERLAIDPEVPDMFDYYTGNKEVDRKAWSALMMETQSIMFRTDSSVSFQNLPGADLTLSAASGSITINASASIFDSEDVGKLISVKFTDGTEEGAARIHTVNSATEVEATVEQTFDSLFLNSGTWLLSFNTVSGLGHLEGETVKILADGGEATDQTVSGGSITLDNDASRVVVGLGYSGVLESLPLETSTFYGPSFTKPVTVNTLGIAYQDTLSLAYGRDRYNTRELILRKTDSYTSFPPLLESGQVQRPANCGHGRGLSYVLTAESPKPCTVNGIVFHLSVGQEDS